MSDVSDQDDVSSENSSNDVLHQDIKTVIMYEYYTYTAY